MVFKEAMSPSSSSFYLACVVKLLITLLYKYFASYIYTQRVPRVVPLDPFDRTNAIRKERAVVSLKSTDGKAARTLRDSAPFLAPALNGLLALDGTAFVMAHLT